ncbi:MAG TPA: hypothetical protein VNV41_16365 [Candidatus Acidoferrales bacterium]|jgi:hypothetical protein|nr:hypothetical protein [Candidatus Acidoferrales bacterium]
MSTRSVIARAGKHEGEFAGIYSHWDGAPHSRGPLLWKIVHEEFKGDLKAALAYLIDKHPAGWSSLDNKNCYCHPSKSKDANFKIRKPEPANILTHEHAVKGETDLEWGYIFDEARNRMFVRDIRHDAESLIELSEPEPDWAVIECGENFERCSHYAWFHGLTPKTSNLSTQAWLGNREMDFHDAIAFIIDGKRWAATGSGGNSDFYNTPLARKHMGHSKPFPRNAWVASVRAKNGRRIDAPVAVMVGHDYKPFPGVTWIFPPTKNNPAETQVSA